MQTIPFLVLFALLSPALTLGAGEEPVSVTETKTDAPLPDLKNMIVAGPYCGVYSLLACCEVFGKKIPIEELLKPEYVGSFQGSSDKELITAVEKFGLYGKSYANMTWRQLQNAKTPMILHFRGSGDSDFNHWVAFLGVDGQHARIVDVPHELATLSMAELLAQWDGVGIVLSEKPIQDEPVWEGRIEYLSVIAFLIGFVFCVKIVVKPNAKEPSDAPNLTEKLKRYIMQTSGMLGVIVFSAIMFHIFSDIGFLKNPTAVAEVTRRYYAVDVPEIAMYEMKQIVAQKNALVFDARYNRDFQIGAIPGARNMPINSSLPERKQILQGVDKSAKIVLYCQSSGCGYADDVASFLKFNGYKNISLFRGGYREWTALQTALK